MTIRANKVKVRKRGTVKTLVAVSGTLSRAFQGLTGMRVSLQDGKSKKTLYRLKAPFTTRGGAYVKKLYITKTSYFMTEVQTPLRILGAGGCRASFGPAVKCVSAFIGPQHVWSNIVKVTPFGK